MAPGNKAFSMLREINEYMQTMEELNRRLIFILFLLLFKGVQISSTPEMQITFLELLVRGRKTLEADQTGVKGKPLRHFHSEDTHR